MDRKLGGVMKTDFLKYLWRWVLFGGIAGLIGKPVTDPNVVFWAEKTFMVIQGVIFGLACAVVFTLLQNKFNATRQRGRSYLFVFLTWMGMKLVFLGVIVALGMQPA